MLQISWITAILQLYSQVIDIFGIVMVKRINIRLFDLLALFHYILNLPRTSYIYKVNTLQCLIPSLRRLTRHCTMYIN